MHLIVFLLTLLPTALLLFLFYRLLKSKKPRKKVKAAVWGVCLVLSLYLNAITGYAASLPMLELNNTYVGEFSDPQVTLEWHGHPYTQQNVLSENFSYAGLKFYGYAEDMHMGSPYTSKIHDLIWPRKIYVEKGDTALKTLYLKGRSRGGGKDGLTFVRTDG